MFTHELLPSPEFPLSPVLLSQHGCMWWQHSTHYTLGRQMMRQDPPIRTSTSSGHVHPHCRICGRCRVSPRIAPSMDRTGPAPTEAQH